MFGAFLFCLGTIFGSFLNVVSLRYDPDRFMLGSHVVYGRSRCPKCGKALRWYELVPILSFILQSGKCRGCGVGISLQYPLVEAASGLILVSTPQVVRLRYLMLPELFAPLMVLWSLALLTLLLISVIDFRIQLIPDEATVFLVVLGVIITALSLPAFGLVSGSFLGGYGALFGLRENIWLNRVAGALVGAAFFGGLIALTRGRGMGMGDLKLSLALGMLFGFAEILVIIALAFLVGSLAGGIAILFRRRGLKSYVPFGPFLALGAAAVFFYGEEIMRAYFNLAGF